MSGPKPRLDQKQVRVRGDRAASVVGALAVAQGHGVAGDSSRCDLIVVEAQAPDDLPRAKPGRPMLVVTRRRLRDRDVRAFEAAGAARVVDADSSVLCVAFALSELLFSTLHEQRQYGRQHGGIAVKVRPVHGQSEVMAQGHLVDVARAGGFVVTEQSVSEGALVIMEMQVAGHVVELRARVAFMADRGFGVEFARDDHDVAPKLSTLCEDPPVLPGRMGSGRGRSISV